MSRIRRVNVPDYAHSVDLSSQIQSKKEFEYTAQQDGYFIMCDAHCTNSSYVKVDDVLVAKGAADSVNYDINFDVMIPVKKGSVIKAFTQHGYDYSHESLRPTVKFVPFK